ncbi:hypothetical protein B0T11DRAFT_64131 [Plectosphaerella cucumerina]|uniref:Uncharacterized protein n=1 Tax=Plectosphaerella cucumerina TaxID=40658 RepID=A0A8K0TS17_9PEZI|nr:hypothetical protein B0T11DRAFT_64131 [Plectosphaerella cucumerina]
MATCRAPLLLSGRWLPPPRPSPWPRLVESRRVREGRNESSAARRRSSLPSSAPSPGPLAKTLSSTSSEPASRRAPRTSSKSSARTRWPFVACTRTAPKRRFTRIARLARPSLEGAWEPPVTGRQSYPPTTTTTPAVIRTTLKTWSGSTASRRAPLGTKSRRQPQTGPVPSSLTVPGTLWTSTIPRRRVGPMASLRILTRAETPPGKS